jgi:hypothetical protein
MIVLVSFMTLSRPNIRHDLITRRMRVDDVLEHGLEFLEGLSAFETFMVHEAADQP